MSRCFLALGGNTGRVTETFDRALERLDAEPLVALGPVSRVYRTAPVGEEAGGEFLNAAVEIETELPPLELLDLLQSIEADFGRTRTIHWGPRALDLDLILYGDLRIELPRLQVPHPACWYRRFVLDPLCEIAGDVVHPQKGVTLHELHRRLLARPFRVFLTGSDRPARIQLIEALRPQFDGVEFRQGDAAEPAGDFNPALLIWLGPECGTGWGATDSDRRESSVRTTRSTRRLAVRGTQDCPTLCLAWLDASTTSEDRAAFLKHVLLSATLQPRPYNRPLRKTP